jgi:hypothetical protein
MRLAAEGTRERRASCRIVALRREERMQARNRTWMNVLGVAVMLIGGAQVVSAASTSPIAEGVRYGSTVQHSAAPSAKAAGLREDMRKSWSDHVQTVET